MGEFTDNFRRTWRGDRIFVPQDPRSARGPARPWNRLDGSVEGGPALHLSVEGCCENLRSKAHAEIRAILTDPAPDATHFVWRPDGAMTGGDAVQGTQNDQGVCLREAVTAGVYIVFSPESTVSPAARIHPLTDQTELVGDVTMSQNIRVRH